MTAARCLLLCALILATACTSAAPAEDAADQALQVEATTQPMDLVDLRLYLRKGRGRDAHLAPVVREVPVTDDLPRTALQLLIDGPKQADPPAVASILPKRTRIRRFDVRNSTAVVDFSSAVVRDAPALRRPPEHEFLALTAIANTLTEFPAIDYVKVTVDGRRSDFWGRWGLPKFLVRDATMTEPPARQLRIAAPDLFRRRVQRVGMARDRPLRLSALHVQTTAAYLRVTAEITAPGGENLAGPVPLSIARREGRDVVLRMRARARPALVGSLRKALSDPAFDGGRVSVNHKRRITVVRLKPRHARPFWLHTFGQPARVVLDIRR